MDVSLESGTRACSSILRPPKVKDPIHHRLPDIGRCVKGMAQFGLGGSAYVESRAVKAVLELREQYPRWGKDKLVVLLTRQGWQVSTSMVGRICTEQSTNT